MAIHRFLLVASFVVGFPWRALATTVSITACGQTVPAHEIGVLEADLDCSATPFGVRLLHGAALQLNGHTIVGGSYAAVAGVKVVTGANPIGSGRGAFAIVGPGVVAGTVSPPIAAGTTACIAVNDGHVSITGEQGRIDIHGCIDGVRGASIFRLDGSQNSGSPNGRGRVMIDHTDLHDSFDAGISARRITATEVTSSNNFGLGMSASRDLAVMNVTASNNGNIGLFASASVSGANVTTVGNGANGVDACLNGSGRMSLTNLHSTNNGGFGVCAYRLNLTDSTVVDNGRSDILSLFQPVLQNTTCGTSMSLDNHTWGVCAND